MKILVLGGSGMLGHAIANELADLDPIVPTREQYQAPNSLKDFDLDKNDYVINCIGAIPQKNKSADEMRRINAEFPHLLALDGEYRVIQIATDCVFSGKKGFYRESDVKDAEDVYGRTKALGENTSFMNLRCSIIGEELSSKRSLLEWLRNQPENAQVSGFANHYWNGITTNAFSKIVKGIIENDLFARFTRHIVPANDVSKYELLKLLAKKYDRKDLEILPTITNRVDRRLETLFRKTNEHLWYCAGYLKPPTISKLIEDLPIN